MPQSAHGYRSWPVWLCLALLGVAACCARPARAAATVTRTFNICTATYSADIDRLGQLQNLRVLGPHGEPGPVLVEHWGINMAALTDNGKGTVSVSACNQTEKNQVEVVLDAVLPVHGNAGDPIVNTPFPEALKIAYTFDDTEVRIKVTNKPVICLEQTLGSSVQVTQNLESMKEMSMPPLRGVNTGPLPSARFTYADGSEVLFRWQGPGNRFNHWEDGGIEADSYNWRCRGSSPNSEYTITYRITPGKPGQIVLAPPQFTISTSAVGNIFFDADEKALQLSMERKDYQRTLTTLGGRTLHNPRIEYRILDHTGAEVQQGSVPIDFAKDPDAAGRITRTVVVNPGKRDCFDANFRVADDQNILRSVWQSAPFSVVQALDPIAQEHDRLAHFDSWNRDAFVGLGLERQQFEFGISPEKGKFDWTKTDLQMKQSAERSKATGVNTYWMFFGSRYPDRIKTPQDAYDIYYAVIDRYKGFNKYWETTNEPNIYLKPQEYLEMYLKPMKLAAEKADPEAKILAPSMCGYGLDFIEELYKLGGKDYFDAISIHPYHGTPYDVQFLEWHSKLRALMAKYGDEKKPVWFTECGFNWWSRASQVYDAKHNVRRILIQDQYGIPKEHDQYYFTSAMGYYNFYVMEGNGVLLPQAVALRARKARLEGAVFDHALDFGLKFARGSIYKTADHQVAVVWTFDNHRTLEVKTDAAAVDAFDMWGNPLKLAVKDGKIAVAASGEPTYLILPLAATCTAVPDYPGRNLADITLGTEATASSERSPAGLVLDGITTSGGWTAGTRDIFPVWLEVAFPIPTTVDRMHLYMPGWDSGGCIKDMNVLGLVNGTYVKLAEVRGNSDEILDVHFTPTAVEKVKLEVTAGFPDITIYEVEFYSSGQAVAATNTINWALAANGAKASASSSWKLTSYIPDEDPKNYNGKVSSKRIEHITDYAPANAIDDKFAPKTWQDYTQTTWIAGDSGKFPAWLQVDFAGKKKITAVVVFVNNFAVWKAADTGISDADIQVWDGNGWKTMGSVTHSKRGIISFVFKEAVDTEKIRLVINDTNDHLHPAVMEMQAWGPKDNGR